MGPGFGPPPGMGRPADAKNKNNLEKPKSLKEVPGYLKKLIGGFFYRLFYIFKLVWETRPWILFLMMFMALFNGFMPVIGAYISASLLNSLVEAYNGVQAQVEAAVMDGLIHTVIVSMIMQFGYIFFNALVNSINGILTRIYGELVVNHIKLKIMNKSKEIDLAGFDSPDFYEKLENASNEAGSRPIQIMNATFNVISTLITLVSFIAILWNVSPFAPAVVIIMSVPSAILTFIYRRKHFMYIRGRSKDRRQMSYYSGLLTNKDMVKEIRIFNLSDTFIGRYTETFKKYFSGLRKLFVKEGIWDICITAVTSVVRCLLFLYIAQGVWEGRNQIGDYSLYTGALNSISGCVGSMIGIIATIYEGTLFIDNMITFMNEKKTIVPQIEEPVSPARHIGHEIEFQHVSFRYPGTERDVIKDVSVTIKPGESVVLVGLNGAGKTTLIKLLTRLYDPTEGRILLDGRDIKDYKVEDLYQIFGIIFQDFGKYAVNVTENISFGELGKEVVQSEIEYAAIQADANEFISKLPDQYDTPLMRIFEENGIELSIGQWQKLAVARAFYSDSDILILDEPTASLDALAEQEIYSQFDKLRKDKTTIFVSHRLSSATVASKIIVLEYGEMIELGNHKELMAKKGRYYELFTTQASRYLSNLEDGTPDYSQLNTGEEAPARLPGDGMMPPPPGFPPMNGSGEHHHGRPPKKTGGEERSDPQENETAKIL